MHIKAFHCCCKPQERTTETTASPTNMELPAQQNPFSVAVIDKQPKATTSRVSRSNSMESDSLPKIDLNLNMFESNRFEDTSAAIFKNMTDKVE